MSILYSDIAIMSIGFAEKDAQINSDIIVQNILMRKAESGNTGGNTNGNTNSIRGSGDQKDRRTKK